MTFEARPLVRSTTFCLVCLFILSFSLLLSISDTLFSVSPRGDPSGRCVGFSLTRESTTAPSFRPTSVPSSSPTNSTLCRPRLVPFVMTSPFRHPPDGTIRSPPSSRKKKENGRLQKARATFVPDLSETQTSSVPFEPPTLLSLKVTFRSRRRPGLGRSTSRFERMHVSLSKRFLSPSLEAQPPPFCPGLLLALFLLPFTP